MKTKAIVLLITGLSLFAPLALVASAGELDEGGSLYAVQNRKHVVAHEFDLGIGIIPLDAFYKGVTTSLGYTYHFSDLFAWEIAHGTYSFNVDTDLRTDLERTFGVRPSEFGKLRFVAGTNAVVKPLYGKFVFLNDQLVYLELFANAGPVLASYDNLGLFAGGNAGFGARLFLSRFFSVRLDVRNYVLFDLSGIDGTRYELHLRAGISLNLG